MIIYLPTHLGDVKLESSGEDTKLICSDLTTFEISKVESFLKKTKVRYEPGKLENNSFTIPGPFSKVHKKFLAMFKPGKPVINAVKLKDGSLQLVQEFSEKEFVAGVTVDKPPRGCPMPVCTKKEVMAQEVLRQFLTPAQWADFLSRKIFLSRGNYSNDPYLLVSRWAPACEKFGVLYSLVHRKPICASMPEIPPAEELLALKLCVELDEFNFVQGVGGVDLTFV